jgi:integrase-like protein
LDPPPPIVRYEYAAPGDLLHLDTKKLGRFHRVGSRITGTHQQRSLGAGFEVAHVCIDDHSRLAYAEVLPNERKETTTAFLVRALDHFQQLGISVARIMTDNGSAYRSSLNCRPVPPPQDAAHLHPSLHPAHQRQGRTLYPDRSA